jgi:hypothetical protein
MIWVILGGIVLGVVGGLVLWTRHGAQGSDE